jgi:hypothetical protein
MALLTADGETPSRSAAARKLPVSATALNISRVRVEGWLIQMKIYHQTCDINLIDEKIRMVDVWIHNGEIHDEARDAHCA